MKHFSYLFLISMVIFYACEKDDINILETDDQFVTDACGLVNTFEDHPHHNEFQTILNSSQPLGFPGISALIYTPEDGLWQGTAGFSSVEDSTLLNYCDVLYSGSVAKTYIVATAMALYEDGLIDLDDSISEYLSEGLIDSLPNANTATISQLMNHTAGMPDIDNDDAYEQAILSNEGILAPATDQLAFLFDDAPLFAAGEGVEYSSTHTMVLAIIIDEVLNYSHGIAVTDKIISKLDLQQTYYKNELGYPFPDKMVDGYVVFQNGERQNISTMSANYCSSVYGDAGVIASAYDYYQFIKNLVEGNIVSKETFDLMSIQSGYLKFKVLDMDLG